MKINWWHDFGGNYGNYVTMSKYTLEFLLIIKYIKKRRFLFCLSVTFGKPVSRKRLKHLLQKGKISNATNWSNREATKYPSACCFGWLSPVSRSEIHELEIHTAVVFCVPWSSLQKRDKVGNKISSTRVYSDTMNWCYNCWVI